jgi:N-dimethylarginine dimethylaminohydrolase
MTIRRSISHTNDTSSLSEFGPLTRVVVKHVRDAFIDTGRIAAQWRDLNFMAPPDLAKAIDEFDRFVEILRSSGASVEFFPRDDQTTLDSIYVRDASIVCSSGVILCNMGKPARIGEAASHGRAYQGLATPAVVGKIDAPGKVEGGDVLWLDDRTIAVGRGYRTNADGIRQLRAILADSIDELIEVSLPHWRGAQDVMHLMSLVSPVDRNLAVVYSPLLPVPFRERLCDIGFTLVEVPDEEFETMGTNVLALAPRRCLMLSGNPITRRSLERAGAEVIEYDGDEISRKGAGGPTCLTRPLERG